MCDDFFHYLRGIGHNEEVKNGRRWVASPTGLSVIACVIGVALILIAGFARATVSFDREEKLHKASGDSAASNLATKVDSITVSELLELQKREVLLRDYISEEHTLWLYECLRDVGISVLLAGLVGIFFEWAGKREFFHEVMRNASIADNITKANVIGLFDRRSKVGFEKLIQETTSIDILLCYSPVFKNDYQRELKEMLRREGTKLRVLLPNPDNECLLNDIVFRFKEGANSGALPSDEDRKIYADKIRLAKDAFSRLRSTEDMKGTVEIYYMNRTPLYSAYVFDRDIVIVPYEHEYIGEYTYMHFGNPGPVYGYFRSDINRIISRSSHMVPGDTIARPPNGDVHPQDH